MDGGGAVAVTDAPRAPPVADAVKQGAQAVTVAPSESGTYACNEFNACHLFDEIPAWYDSALSGVCGFITLVKQALPYSCLGWRLLVNIY